MKIEYHNIYMHYVFVTQNRMPIKPYFQKATLVENGYAKILPYDLFKDS